MEDAFISLSTVAMVVAILYWLISAGVRSGMQGSAAKADESSRPAPDGVHPLRAFPVQPIPGTYKVTGVDKRTRMDCVQYYRAVGPDNARVRAELDEIIVTSVEYDA